MSKQTEALKLALEAIEKLWNIVDDIDTYGDMAKADEKLYRSLVERRQRTRFEETGISTDGYTLNGGAITAIREALAEQTAQHQEPVTVLPDGSAFAVMSYPLPKDHWLYADRQYNDGEYEPVELGKPVLTHELRDAVVSAVRYAIRGATNCGKEVDFDPDALVQNAVYALCGPFTSPPASRPLTDEEIEFIRVDEEFTEWGISEAAFRYAARAIEAKLKEKNT